MAITIGSIVFIVVGALVYTLAYAESLGGGDG